MPDIKTKIGTINDFEKDHKIVMKMVVGSAKDKEGRSFELAVGAFNNAPIVSLGGVDYILNWNDILNLAIDNGLIEAAEKEKKR